MPILKTVLIILEVISSVVMILVVMFQSGKEAGLSGALTGNADNYMSKSKFGNMDKTLASATKWVALVWVLLTLSLSLI
ncbi:MAG: preprotein translocase subunit SecG [Oscillospiraceae bacterium]|nr:preprotein translocase subunit SecG [Oscillospiraceae bacterium]